MNQVTSLSPCINVCRLDDSGMCVGCGRLLNEVASWSRMSPQQQIMVREQAAIRLDERAAARPQGAEPAGA